MNKITGQYDTSTENKITSFCEFTGKDRDTAVYYLRMHNWSLLIALEDYTHDVLAEYADAEE